MGRKKTKTKTKVVKDSHYTHERPRFGDIDVEETP